MVGWGGGWLAGVAELINGWGWVGGRSGRWSEGEGSRGGWEMGGWVGGVAEVMAGAGWVVAVGCSESMNTSSDAHAVKQ